MSDAPKKPLGLHIVPTPNAKLEALRQTPAQKEPRSPSAAPISDALTGDQAILRDRIIESLQTVYDPELPVNIHDLGLIYAIDIDAEFNASIRMTLTAPACPVADSIVREVERKVAATPGVNGAKVLLVWDPPWDKSRMSEAALLELGLL